MIKHMPISNHHKGEEILVSFRQDMNLHPGQYALSLGCVAINDSGIEVYNRLYDIILFEIIGSQQMSGFFDLKSQISIDPIK